MSVRRHLDLVDEYRRKGLQIYHFGQEEQYTLLHALPEKQRVRLGNILTTLPRDRFYLKGQAANRNLSYLKCLQLTNEKNRTLYYMVDSDEVFCVNRLTERGERIDYALNYFYVIDRIFRTTDTLMVTGKLVGDPPVSPSVMTSNFLDDVSAFFISLAERQRDEACGYHLPLERIPGHAAYHDLAKLFGIGHEPGVYPYRCRLEGEHDHAACLNDFSLRLNGFFFGEHLTRKTYFNYGQGITELTPARTLYPGNYAVNYEGLKYIIPFGHLRLRMSGPTAGRLIAAEIKHRFASVNLPHLHQRISETGLSNDFRPGVELSQEGVLQAIDLSDEFERQYFGDLMLFSAEALAKETDIGRPFQESAVVEVVERKDAELLALYQLKHREISIKNQQLRDLVWCQDRWWINAAELAVALERIKCFIDNVQRNFSEDSPAWKRIRSSEYRRVRVRQIVEALVNYRCERDAWDSLISSIS